jgi:hypothetical protein
MENNSASDIYGNTADCPYLNNTLLARYGRAAKYADDLGASVPSEPHYIWIEAGTNKFSDHTFTTDAAPSASNSTGSKNHLATRLQAKGIGWRLYAEGLDGVTGACPMKNDTAVASAFAVRHQPFTFFRDISGLNPNNTACAAHVKPFSALAGDLSANTVAKYNFITPNLCHDMHVQGCGTTHWTASQKRKAGDTWLSQNMPALIQYANANKGLVLIAWDEPEGGTAPFIVVSPDIKSPGYVSHVALSHSSLTKSLQQIFELDPAHGGTWLGHAGDPGVSNIADFFQPGAYP